MERTPESGPVGILVVVGCWSTSEDAAERCDGPSKPSVDPLGADRSVLVASPRAEGLRPAVEVKRSCSGIHHDPGFHFKRCGCVVSQHVERISKGI